MNWVTADSGNGVSAATPLPETMLTYSQLDPQEQISFQFESKYKSFINENAFKDPVCEMEAILSRGDELKPDDIFMHW